MIAVVVNALDKAYFLRENDPVFNGYVVKITGDSIIFKETIQDRLGKSFPGSDEKNFDVGSLSAKRISRVTRQQRILGERSRASQAKARVGESEMRKQLLGVFFVAGIGADFSDAETQGAGSEPSKHAALKSVNVVRTDDGVSVEINAHGAVKPRLSTLDHPARVVVDLPNTVIASSAWPDRCLQRRSKSRTPRH